MQKLKKIISNTWYNYRLPIILGTILFTILTLHVYEFDIYTIHWYYIGVLLCSAGSLVSIGYIIYKMLK